MRIGLIALLHESNTFSAHPTRLEGFRQNLLLEGEAIREAMEAAHHEVGGFFSGLARLEVTAVPLFAARALPAGTIAGDDFQHLVDRLLETVRAAGPLDGYLVAPHGATVSERYPDADGYWLHQLREVVGPTVPVVGTLDAHANLSPAMVSACDALVAYRTNPHLDQRQRGEEAADLVVAACRGTPLTMAAMLPPLAISIERQCTDEDHLVPLYETADAQLERGGVISNSILLGFPYSDVAEMGSAVIAVTEGDRDAAATAALELGSRMWSMREAFHGDFIDADAALAACAADPDHVYCLLDMGDNVGGGSSADGTELLAAIARTRFGPSFMCIHDPEAVVACEQAGVGATLTLSVGGKTDAIHGQPVSLEMKVASLHAGRFREAQPRHGGITDFDQGRTAIGLTEDGLTLMLTSRRIVPFSLQQLVSCQLDPSAFRLLVAKGVNAPLAAYREVADRFIRVNTQGSTCADMRQLTYAHRRRPLFPLESETVWQAELEGVVWGHSG